MFNPFQLTPGDKSYEYLGKIFGSMSGILPGGDLSILGSMFKTFNTVVLAIAALMVLYMTVVGVMATAHEGEFMGKKWNNIWIPIRSVLGIAMLIPTSTGYSGLQVVMMWVIIQGIGAADTLWNTALSYANMLGSPYAQGTLGNVGVTQSMNQLFQGLVCDATTRFPNTAPDPYNEKGAYYCTSHKGGFCGQTINFPGSTTGEFLLGPGPGGCGKLVYSDPAVECAGDKAGKMSCVSSTAQKAALQAIVPVLAGIANEFVQADYSYRVFVNGGAAGSTMAATTPSWIRDYCSANGISPKDCCVKTGDERCPNGSTFPSANAKNGSSNANSQVVTDIIWPYWPQFKPKLGNATFINTITDQYMTEMTKAYSSFISAKANQPLSGDLAEAQDKGWLFAGGYYYTLANMNGADLKGANAAFSFVPSSSVTTGDLASYRNNFGAAAVLLQGASKAQNVVQDSELTSQSSQVVADATKTVNLEFQNNVTNAGKSSPLARLQMIGQVLLGIAFALIIAITAILIVLAIVGNLNIYVLGTGFDNPIGPAAQILLFWLLPAIYGLIGMLISLGGTLAIYIPLIPYVVFTFGAISWFISVFETMAAGPLVALGVISPSGHHELMGKAEPAILLLFNVFLRPSLMIFGLISAMLLASVVIEMINALFWTTVFRGINATDPIGAILMLGAYVALISAALNKCFSAINVIPQQVMRWIGGQGEAVEAPMGEIKQGVEAAGKGAEGAGVGAGKAGESSMKEQQKIKQGQAQKKPPDAPKVGTGGDSTS